MGVQRAELDAAALASANAVGAVLKASKKAAGYTGSSAAGPQEEAKALRAEVAALRTALSTSRDEVELLRRRVQEVEAGGGGDEVPRPLLALPDPDERDRRRVLDHLTSQAFVNLGPSPIAGVGVFACRPVPAGIDPFVICNPHLAAREQFVTFSAKELRGLAPGVMEQVRAYFAPLTEEDGWTPQREDGEIMYGVLATGLNSLNLSWYLNHSDEPNVIFKDAESEGEFNTYVTKRVIAEGEELTADYRELGQEFYALVSGERGQR